MTIYWLIYISGNTKENSENDDTNDDSTKADNEKDSKQENEDSSNSNSNSKQDKSIDETDSGQQEKSPDDIKEIGGPAGPEPTRYGDWEKGGRCYDF